jgi:multiple sugar transport system substrate-binding protein
MSVRKTLAASLATVLAVGVLAGCGSKEQTGSSAQDQTQPAAQPAQKVTITFWTHTHPPMVDLNKKLVEEYQNQNPNVTIDYQIIPNTEFGQKMLTAMSTGTGPDIINMDDSALRSTYIPKGMLSEVDPVALGYKSMDDLKKAYVPGAFEGAQLDGKIFGVPSEFNVTTFIINTDAFKEAGLDPNSPPKTWDEVGQMGQKLVKKEGDKVVRRGFDFLYLHSGWYTNQLSTLLLQTGGTYHGSDSKSLLDKPEAIKALQTWSDMITKYKVADPKIASREATQPYDDFANGRVAMSLMNPWGLASFKGTPIEGKYKVVPLPQADPAKPVNPFYAYYWAVSAKSKVKTEAFKFIAYISSQNNRWLKDVNFIQPKAGWEKLQEAKDIPFFDVWASEMQHGKFAQPTSSQEKDIIKAAIERTVLNGEDPAKSFTQAKGEVDKSLN